MGYYVAAGSGRSDSLWHIVVGPRDMSMVNGTTSGSWLLVLLPWDPSITLSITLFSGLQGAIVCRNLLPIAYKSSGNVTGVGSNFFLAFFILFFFSWHFLWPCLKAAQIFLPLHSFAPVFSSLKVCLCDWSCSFAKPRLGPVSGWNVWMHPWVLVWKGTLTADSQEFERGTNQTPKQSCVLGDEQRLSMNLSSFKASCYLVCLLLERFPQQINWFGKRKRRLPFLGHSRPGKNRGERELFDGELCEAGIKGIWEAVNLFVAVSDPWWVCGITTVWSGQIHISDNILWNCP